MNYADEYITKFERNFALMLDAYNITHKAWRQSDHWLGDHPSDHESPKWRESFHKSFSLLVAKQQFNELLLGE